MSAHLVALNNKAARLRRELKAVNAQLKAGRDEIVHAALPYKLLGMTMGQTHVLLALRDALGPMTSKMVARASGTSHSVVRRHIQAIRHHFGETAVTNKGGYILSAQARAQLALILRGRELL
jgi:hypothetical protein